MIDKYVKMSIEVEAIQWTGNNTKEIKDFVNPIAEYLEDENAIVIPTLEGDMKAKLGDYIIKGIKGEFYPCDKDIFEKTYEKIINLEVPKIKHLRRDIDNLISKVRTLESCRETSIAITKLQEAVMWLGMDLKRLNEPNPYPSSKDPSTGTKIEPTADGLHF